MTDYSRSSYQATVSGEYHTNGTTAKRDASEQDAASLDRRIRFYVYTSHFLSAWGDRMWQFGVGMFMVIIAPESLRLTAVYGLSMGAAILLLGAHVGNMVDKIPRLSAARLTLVVQNISVAVCAVIIYFVIVYKPAIRDTWPGEGLLTLCYACIIIVAIVSSLASTGNTIAVERDWVVEICGKEGDSLAAMSAAMKSIDLTTNIVAPIATGQVMAYAGVDIGAIFIAAWNIVSVFVEYYMLWKVYSLVPALRVDKNKRQSEQDNDSQQKMVYDEPLCLSESIKLTRNISTPPPQPQKDVTFEVTQTSMCCSCLQGMLSGVTILIRGWKTFMTYDVAFAGLALSTLYFTVIGFDNVTVGFAYTQGVNESIMGILMAAGAAVGIIGTILYPRMVKCIGLVRTGLFGFLIQICVSTLCVVSIWAPGSPFDPFIRSRDVQGTLNHTADETGTMTPLGNYTALYGNVSGYENNVTSSANVTESTQTNTTPVQSSIIMLLTGVVGARCGLWITDLTITQLFLHGVRETERGVVLGVQTSLNQFMDMLKFILVIIAPEPELFGILVLISFGLLCVGWLLYAKYARSARGHLFHFNMCLHVAGLGPRNKYERLDN